MITEDAGVIHANELCRDGIRKIFVVFAHKHDIDLRFLAAYDGEGANQSAEAFIKIVERASPELYVTMAAVDLLPMIRVTE